MRTLSALLVAAAFLSADDTPTPAGRARELLENAREAISATRPDVQAAGLYHLADTWLSLDRKHALAVAEEAFRAAGAIPAGVTPENKHSLQGDIVLLIAQSDKGKALELLRQIPPGGRSVDSRWKAVHGLVDKLVAERDFNAAIALVQEIGSTGHYSFSGVHQIIRSLPEGDERIVPLFSAAITAYRAKPADGFAFLIGAVHARVPPQLASEAVDAVLRHILSLKEDPMPRAYSMATSKGFATVGSNIEYQLFQVMGLVQKLQPKRAEELYLKYPALRSLAEQYPLGVASLDDGGPRYSFVVGSKGGAKALNLAGLQSAALVQMQTLKALRLADEDPEQALAMAPSVVNEAKQLQVYAAAARALAAKKPAKAREAMDAAMEKAWKMKDAGPAWEALDNIAQTAHQLGDADLIRKVLDRQFWAASMLAKQDASAEIPNPVPRDQWPSTQAYRVAIYRATKSLNVDELEALLARIADNDLNVLMRIEVARALLGRPLPSLRTMTPRRKPAGRPDA